MGMRKITREEAIKETAELFGLKDGVRNDKGSWFNAEKERSLSIRLMFGDMRSLRDFTISTRTCISPMVNVEFHRLRWSGQHLL